MSESRSPLRLAVLISGTGSNLRTLIDARGRGELDIDICLVISNRPEAPGLDHARAARIPFRVINRSTCAAGMSEDQAVAAALRESQAELILLSGYMRILGAGLVNAFAGRMINQHPSLLPKYKGLDTYQRVLDAGDPEHGASVHFVTAALDDGPVIAQARVPVKRADDAQTLAARLGPVEHRLLVAVMRLFAARRLAAADGCARLDGNDLQQPLSLLDDELQLPQ